MVAVAEKKVARRFEKRPSLHKSVRQMATRKTFTRDEIVLCIYAPLAVFSMVSAIGAYLSTKYRSIPQLVRIVPIHEQPGEFASVTIGADTWIGDRAVVMADVGKHSVVGAGSVVTKPLYDCAVACGSPASVMRLRETSATHSMSDAGV